MPKPFQYWDFQGHKVLFWRDNFEHLFISVKTIDTIIGEESFPSDLDDRHIGHIFGMHTRTKTIDNHTLHLYPDTIACLSLHRAIRRGNEKAKTFLNHLIHVFFQLREQFGIRDFTPTNENILDVLEKEAFQGEYKPYKFNRR